jgi:phenylpyruvate tautomerase PptA (4-oxalocrotonate tautomerase family)
MPVYTCTTTGSTLNTDAKARLAGEIAKIHSTINHVPSTYVNVVFHDLPVENVYTDGMPASPVLVSGWVRAGHQSPETTRLAAQVAAAVARIAAVAADRVLVVIQSSPARFAVEGGRVLPEPGDERSWLGSE